MNTDISMPDYISMPGELYVMYTRARHQTDVETAVFPTLDAAIEAATAASLTLKGLNEDPTVMVGRVMPMRSITTAVSTRVL